MDEESYYDAQIEVQGAVEWETNSSVENEIESVAATKQCRIDNLIKNSMNIESYLDTMVQEEKDHVCHILQYSR